MCVKQILPLSFKAILALVCNVLVSILTLLLLLTIVLVPFGIGTWGLLYLIILFEP